jgi:Ca2+-binding EF-hand superfamily protein
LSSILVIFRVFDEDEDGVINKEDLISGLKLLYYGTSIDNNTIERMAEKILEECEAYEGDSIHFDGIRF